MLSFIIKLILHFRSKFLGFFSIKKLCHHSLLFYIKQFQYKDQYDIDFFQKIQLFRCKINQKLYRLPVAVSQSAICNFPECIYPPSVRLSVRNKHTKEFRGNKRQRKHVIWNGIWRSYYILNIDTLSSNISTKINDYLR
jgi:hypothetical protein